MVITSLASSSPPSTEGISKSLNSGSTPSNSSPPVLQNKKSSFIESETDNSISNNNYSNNGFSRENSLPFLMDLAIEDNSIVNDDEDIYLDDDNNSSSINNNNCSRNEEILNSKSQILINESYNNCTNSSNINQDNNNGSDNSKEKSYIPKQFKKVTYNDNPTIVNNVIFNNNNNNNEKPQQEISVSPIINSSNNNSSNNNSNNCENINNNGIIDEDDEPSIVVSEDIGAVSSSTTTMNSFEVNPSHACGQSLASELSELFSHFRRYKQPFPGKRDEELYKYQEVVNKLFEKDYKISKINNKEGELCATYPPELIVIEHEKETNCPACKEKQKHVHPDQSQNLHKLLHQSRFARVRTRFPFPVIYYHHKNLCRSSTLSQKIEFMFQSGVNSMKKQFASIPSASPSLIISSSSSSTSNSQSSTPNVQLNLNGNNNIISSVYGSSSGLNEDNLDIDRLNKSENLSLSSINGNNTNNNNSNNINNNNSNNNNLTQQQSSPPKQQSQKSQQQPPLQPIQQDDNLSNSTFLNNQNAQNQIDMETLRNNDILVIKHLNIRFICDLMVENKKKKFGFFVCSSEKVDMHRRYQDFILSSTPYPGVEFFADFNKNQHSGKDLYYCWEGIEDPAELSLHPDYKLPLIPWESYKNWDLIILTQNYFKLLLKYISEESNPSGVLVHCISGWDRTPLFISLLRISLWADGEIHHSLKDWEMLFLTVAYDWFLFSHQLCDRANRGEDIFYFCFYFLEYISSMEFSIHSFNNQEKQTNQQNQVNQQQQPTSNDNNSTGSSSIGLLKQQLQQQQQKEEQLKMNRKASTSQQQQHPVEIVNNYVDKNVKNSNNSNSNKMKSSPNNSKFSSSPNSWNKGLDSHHSAPVTPQNNSPKLYIGINKVSNSSNNNNNSSSYHNNHHHNNHSYHHHSNSNSFGNSFGNNFISAPSTPAQIPSQPKNIQHTSPTISSSIPVDVPNQQKRRGSEEEIGGSWQLMGSFTDRRSSLNSNGSTPKNFHPSSSYTSTSGQSETDDNNQNTNNEEYDSDCLAQSWDNAFSFEQDNSKYFETLKNQINSNKSQQQQSSQNKFNNSSFGNGSNKSSTTTGHHHHHHSQNLTFKEIEERRKKRLNDIKILFIHFYQNHCSTYPESYWKTIMNYLPKFG